MTFVSFSVEIAGGFGPVKKFVKMVVEWAGNVPGVHVYGWHTN